MRIFISVLSVIFFIVSFDTTPAGASTAPDSREVRAAIDRACAFMMDSVALRGGFVWSYSGDITRRWGEVPARPSQIWVQGATNGVGEMMLDIYSVTGDPRYLGYAKRIAGALVAGQHPSGGWHYFIDFDMNGIEKWYEDIASRCWGWEEYYHYYGNCTFDDDVTTSSIHFLQRLLLISKDPAYRAPLFKALQFMLDSQYPVGAWPQRYPLTAEYVKDAKSDYTSFYTLNDNVLYENVRTMFSAWEMFGDEAYRDAAIRGMNFLILAQCGTPQSGWGDQYTPDLKPAHARSYEPAAISTWRTIRCIEHLEEFYRMTGDRRYLSPIPAAIEWLKSSAVNSSGRDIWTHALYYEPGTNRPMYVHREGRTKETGRYYSDYTIGNSVCHLVQVMKVDIPAIEREYKRAYALSPADAQNEYAREDQKMHTDPPAGNVDIRTLIDSLDARGAWVTGVKIPNYADPCAELKGDAVTENLSGETMQGISTRVFLERMKQLAAHYSRFAEKK